MAWEGGGEQGKMSAALRRDPGFAAPFFAVSPGEKWEEKRETEADPPVFRWARVQ